MTERRTVEYVVQLRVRDSWWDVSPTWQPRTNDVDEARRALGAVMARRTSPDRARLVRRQSVVTDTVLDVAALPEEMTP